MFSGWQQVSKTDGIRINDIVSVLARCNGKTIDASDLHIRRFNRSKP